jgi:lysophospholipase L1-like esterase
MNTNPDAVTILCYGDSNTWGQKPDRSGRYPANVRWTGTLQSLLGDSYDVIEEGLSSRTTDLEHKKPGRNGKTYFVPCLLSHNPLDVVVIMLGTNDLKIEFDRGTADVAAAVGGLVDDVVAYAQNRQKHVPQVIIISPIHIDETAEQFANLYPGNYDQAAAEKSRQLATDLSRMAEAKGCTFLDASTVAKAGSDGIHMDEASHPALGKLVAETIKSQADTFVGQAAV